MPCLCLCVYHVVCFFSVVLLLDIFAFDAIARIRSTMIGSSSLWTRSSSERDFRQDDHDLGYLYYLCLLVVSMLSLCRASYHIYVSLPYAMIQPLTTLTQQIVVWLCYRFAQPLSYSVASCRCSCRLFHVGTWICWDITISLI